MQICHNCHSKQLDGAIFCSDCGANMLPSSRRETTMSLGQRGPTGDLAPAPASPPATEAAKRGPSLTLLILNSGRRITVEVDDDRLIGRKDNARGIFPDVDLGLDGGYDAGVSRRHAILGYKDGTYTVEDLGSSNGTFVNGRQVTPQSVAPLANGDELKCGTLLMRVEFG